MADINIDDFTGNLPQVIGPIWISTTVGYLVYTPSGAVVPVYRKTTDGGETWGDAVAVSTVGYNCFGVWYDRWTPGDTTGTLIHICGAEVVNDRFYYRNLDTADDTLSAVVTLDGPAGASGGGSLSVIKARNGNLYACGYNGSNSPATNLFFVRSTDGGATWTQRTSPGNTDSTVAARLWLAPGNEADGADIWAIQHLNGTSILVLKVYDDSANSWSTTTIATGMAGNQNQYLSVATRLSDNHAIVVAFDAAALSPGNVRAWDVADATDITALTNVLDATDDVLGVGVQVDDNTGDLYVAYNLGAGGTPQTNTTAYYKRSTDGGVTWGSQTQYSESAGYSGRNCFLAGSVGADGGRFYLVWFSNAGVPNDLIFGGFTNSVLLQAGAAAGGGPSGLAAQIRLLLF